MSGSSTDGRLAPELSIVVVSFNGEPLLTRCLAALQAESARHVVDTLVVADWHRRSGGPGDRLMRAFPDVRWVASPPGGTVPRMRAIGIAESRANIVALIEDDCLVQPGWCDALLAAHRGRDGAVGGAVEPGPYRRALDWAVYFCDYAPYMLPLRPGPAVALPGNNMSFTRAACRRLPSEAVHELYEVSACLAWQQARVPMRAEPAVLVKNVNSWTFDHVMRIPYHHGRAYAGRRLADRPLPRRLTMGLLAMLLPVLKVGRAAGEVVSRRRLIGSLARALPWMILLSVSWSFGESVGYLFGPGDSPSKWR